jgi:alpha-methylacyl-CoA racemase
VTERLGVGPDACLARNPRLVYGRITGWGQDGPNSTTAGHDIDYIALTGALDAIGRRGEGPQPPLNLVGDFGGGGMLLALGVVCGILEARSSNQGQVVDAAMVDGASLLMTAIYSLRAVGWWTGGRGENLLDSGAPFYDVYETSDGGFLAVGPIEPQFHSELYRVLGLAAPDEATRWDKTTWPAEKERLAAAFRRRTRDEWCALFDGTDACVAPVLSLDEAPRHPHNVSRGTFVEVDGVVQPAPAPRFSRTAAELRRPPGPPGLLADEALHDWGFEPDEVRRLRESGAVA